MLRLQAINIRKFLSFLALQITLEVICSCHWHRKFVALLMALAISNRQLFLFFCLGFCSYTVEDLIMQLFEFLLTIVGSPRFVKVCLWISTEWSNCSSDFYLILSLQAYICNNTYNDKYCLDSWKQYQWIGVLHYSFSSNDWTTGIDHMFISFLFSSNMWYAI